MLTTTRTYDELVAEGREARERADEMQWIEGDLALEIEVLPPDERPRDPETGAFIEDEGKALRRYAEDVGIAYSSLQTYRRVAKAWPPTTRAHSSWDVHRALAAQEDRFEIRADMTVREAEKLVRDRTAGNQGKPAWLELVGRVGDDLTKARKDMDKFEAALGEKKPTEKIATKAGRYAGWAEDIAQRLRRIEVSAQ